MLRWIVGVFLGISIFLVFILIPINLMIAYFGVNLITVILGFIWSFGITTFILRGTNVLRIF